MKNRGMKKLILMLGSCMMMSWVSTTARASVSLDSCQNLARENYPVLRNYGIIDEAENVSLSEINRGWLPKIGIYGQATVQNVVPSFPSVFKSLYAQHGLEMRGMSRFQYKGGVDLNQTIWDGGMSKDSREIIRRQNDMQRAATEVELYTLRERVQNVYFAILLITDQIEQVKSGITVLESNLQRVRSMRINGVAMQSDENMVEAELLSAKQRLTEAAAAESGYRQMLTMLTGRDMEAEQLELPEADLPTDLSSMRPEYALFESRELLNEARIKQTEVAEMPKIGMFAQAYYGYPGIDYFKSMQSREPNFNIIGGIKLTWNIDSYYTKRLNRRKIELENEQIAIDRDKFNYNSRVLIAQDYESIKGMSDVMKDDSRIVELRSEVRHSAESQLLNGVIDATSLISKINDETQAKLNETYHKIEYIQKIYNLKNRINR